MDSIANALAGFDVSGDIARRRNLEAATGHTRAQLPTIQQQTRTLELENQQREQGVRDAKILSEAYKQVGLDPAITADQAPRTIQQLLIRNGASAGAVMGFQKHNLEIANQLAGVNEKNWKNEASLNNATGEALATVVQAAPGVKADAWPAAKARLVQLHPDWAAQLPDQYPGDDWATTHLGIVGYTKKLLDQRKEQVGIRETEQRIKGEQVTQQKTEAELPGIKAKSEQEQRQLDAQSLAAAARQGPQQLEMAIGEMPVKRARPFLGLKTADEILRIAVPPEKQVPPITAAPEQQYINEYRGRHPGATVEDAIRAYTQIQGAPGRVEAHERASMARTDRSYQFHARELDTVSRPIDDLSARLSRMQETLAQGNPTADALLAPELMTIVAGGQGSGVRLTQAEINSVVGGRSVWEGLRAAAQKWSTDPNSASAITPDQRERIRALAMAVDRKVKTKQAALANARADLANSDNVADHRAIVNKARQQVTQIEQETANATSQGQIRVKRKSDGKTGTMPAANFDANKYDKLP